MEIKDLRPNMGNIDLVIEVVKKEEPRTFKKFGKNGRVCDAKVKDPTGEVKLTLWDEEVDLVKAGDRIHLQNGWCSEFRGEKQISTGRTGQIEVLGSGKGTVFTNEPEMLKSTPASKDGGDDDDDDDSEPETVEEEEI